MQWWLPHCLLQGIWHSYCNVTENVPPSPPRTGIVLILGMLTCELVDTQRPEISYKSPTRKFHLAPSMSLLLLIVVMFMPSRSRATMWNWREISWCVEWVYVKPLGRMAVRIPREASSRGSLSATASTNAAPETCATTSRSTYPPPLHPQAVLDAVSRTLASFLLPFCWAVSWFKKRNL